MAIKRSGNFIGQQRLDIPQLRAIESGIANDFDTLAGQVWAGEESLIIRGFTIPVTSTFGNPASSLQLNVTDGLVFHYNGTEAGTVLPVTVGRTLENLNVGNSRVSGAFTSSAINYVGIDFTRTADSTTADTTKFYDPNTKAETTRVVPQARVLDYKIYISVTPFSFTPNICPVAQVQTDSNGNVVSITDARQMMFRLGSGGDAPSAISSYIWRDTNRRENPITYAPATYNDDPFSGGDKQILSMKEWMDAVTSVLWEAKSGESWYSPTSRDIMKVIYAPGPGALLGGDNFSWTLPNLSWVNLFVTFENASGGYYNTVTDGTLPLSDGQCLYVDVNRTDTVTPIVAAVAFLNDLPSPAIPGSRIVLAYRIGTSIYVRDRSYEIGRAFSVATQVTTPGATAGGTLGVVKLSHAAVTPAAPIVMSDGAANVAFGFVALNTNRQAAYTAISGVGLTVNTPTASTSAIEGYATNILEGIGVFGQASGVDGVGVSGNAGSGFGVLGNTSYSAGGSAYAGVVGYGGGVGNSGVLGRGLNTNCVGVYGEGSSAGGTVSHGVHGISQGFGVGIYGEGSGAFDGGSFLGGATGDGLTSTGGATSGLGIRSIGGSAGTLGNTTANNANSGLIATGRTSGNGVEAYGGGTGGWGIRASGNSGSTGGGGIFFKGGGTNGAADTDISIQVNENIKFAGQAPAGPTVPFNNSLNVASFIKHWGTMTGAGASDPTSQAGFGGWSAADGASAVEVVITFDAASQMASSTYAVFVYTDAPIISYVTAKATTGFSIVLWDSSTNTTISTSALKITFMVIGDQ